MTHKPLAAALLGAIGLIAMSGAYAATPCECKPRPPARSPRPRWPAASASTFNSGACGAASAAGDYGYSRTDVAAAFDAVGVTCQ